MDGFLDDDRRVGGCRDGWIVEWDTDKRMIECMNCWMDAGINSLMDG